MLRLGHAFKVSAPGLTFQCGFSAKSCRSILVRFRGSGPFVGRILQQPNMLLVCNVNTVVKKVNVLIQCLGSLCEGSLEIYGVRQAALVPLSGLQGSP